MANCFVLPSPTYVSPAVPTRAHYRRGGFHVSWLLIKVWRHATRRDDHSPRQRSRGATTRLGGAIRDGSARRERDLSVGNLCLSKVWWNNIDFLLVEMWALSTTNSWRTGGGRPGDIGIRQALVCRGGRPDVIGIRQALIVVCWRFGDLPVCCRFVGFSVCCLLPFCRLISVRFCWCFVVVLPVCWCVVWLSFVCLSIFCSVTFRLLRLCILLVVLLLFCALLCRLCRFFGQFFFNTSRFAG